MLPDRVSNPGLLTDESGALPIALGSPALPTGISQSNTEETLEILSERSVSNCKNITPLKASNLQHLTAKLLSC